MRYLSVCSGIEAASVAWGPLGWEAAAFAEVDPFPSAVLAHRFPGVPNLGDFTQIGPDAGPVDLLVGGTPCQSFSVAGRRAGLADPRGVLALEFLALAGRLRPRWLVWENVPGVLSSDGGRDFGAFLGAVAELGYGWAYRVLDARFFGVPQRRRRVFLVGHLGSRRRASVVLLERPGLRRHPAPGREAGQDIADSLEASLGRRNGQPDCGSRKGHLIVAFSGNNTAGPIDVATACNAHGGPHGRLDFESETFAVSGNEAGTLVHELARGSAVRRLTPRECERLQGFEDDWTLIPWKGRPAEACPDGPRYRAIGNSMAVPVIRWIGERLAAVEADTRFASTRRRLA